MSLKNSDMIASIPATMIFFYVVKIKQNIFLRISSTIISDRNIRLTYFCKDEDKNLDRLKCTKEEWAGEEEGLKPIRKLSTLNRISDT